MEIEHTDGRFFTKTGHGKAELLYKIENGNIMSIYHTFVPDEERGKGIAERLARSAFAFAKEKSFKVRPDCPYIVHFIEKHKEYRQYSTGMPS